MNEPEQMFCPRCGEEMVYRLEGQKVRRGRWTCNPCRTTKRRLYNHLRYQRLKANDRSHAA